VRKAGLPVAYSAGFSPHPKISYSGGVSTGAASEAEYLEIALTAHCDPQDVRARLDAALPGGIDVIEVLDLALLPEAPRLEASHWQVVLPGVAPADADRAVTAFLASASAEVERLTSKGVRRFDTRPAVRSMELDRRAAQEQGAGCAILRMVVRHLTPAVRPDDILTALRQQAALAPSSPPLVTRLAQGPLGMEAAAAPAPAPGLTGSAGSPAPDGAAADASAPSGRQRLAQQQDLAQRQEETTRPGAGPAMTASAAPVSAYDQLPRGAEGPETALRAREPDGRLPECSRSSHRIEEKTVMTGLRPPASPLI